MKIDCCKIVIDKNKIMQEIENYRCINNTKNPSYIVMNQETYDKLNSEIMPELFKYQCPRVSKMYDISLAISDSLKFGEIEIV